MRNKRIIIGGGGTGGHIFPAISIANAIRKTHPYVEILFVGAENKIEMEKVPEAGYRIIGLPVAGFQRSFSVKNVSFFIKLWKSMRKAAKIINDFKPDLAIGVGGYASGPILKAAASKGIPIAIQEQNSYAGLTNKLLAKKAKKIFVAYDKMERYFPKEKIILTGNPVRSNLINTETNREEAFRFFGLDQSMPVIMALGGSLGAKTINESIMGNLELLGDDVQILWQTGNFYYENIKAFMQGKQSKNIKILPFIKDMQKAFYVADIIISRAGAGTISELAIVGKPVILVPSPNVAEDHQTKNAMALALKSAAIHISDVEARSKLMKTSLELLKNKDSKKELSENIKKLAITDSADKIVTEVFKLL